MREGISVEMSAADRARLEAVVADRNSPQKHVWRARIVLATADGLGTGEIVRRTGKSKPCVWRWQERFGPPPEEWRGGIRTSRGRAHVDPFHAGPRLGRGAVAQGRVQALPVVEDLDILEHRRPGLRPGAEADVVDVLLLERGEEGLHRRVV